MLKSLNGSEESEEVKRSEVKREGKGREGKGREGTKTKGSHTISILRDCMPGSHLC